MYVYNEYTYVYFPFFISQWPEGEFSSLGSLSAQIHLFAQIHLYNSFLFSICRNPVPNTGKDCSHFIC